MYMSLWDKFKHTSELKEYNSNGNIVNLIYLIEEISFSKIAALAKNGVWILVFLTEFDFRVAKQITNNKFCKYK